MMLQHCLQVHPHIADYSNPVMLLKEKYSIQKHLKTFKLAQSGIDLARLRQEDQHPLVHQLCQPVSHSSRPLL